MTLSSAPRGRIGARVAGMLAVVAIAAAAAALTARADPGPHARLVAAFASAASGACHRPVALRPGVRAVALATDPTTGGYWILTSTGRVISSGAPWRGSLGGKLPHGVTVTSITAAGGGYLILTSDGGVHAFGTKWYGSDAGRLRPGVRAVALAADPTTGGYWILTSSGRVTAFHARGHGSLAGRMPYGNTAAAIAAGRRGGYLVLLSSGGPAPADLAGRVWNVIPTRRKIVALTFDIGPRNGVPSILTTLRRDHVPGTFFLVGGTVARYPAMAKAIAAAGERLADHSNRHPHFTRISSARMRSEVMAAQAKIKTATWLDPWPWFRFPYGNYNARAISAVNAAGFVPVGWTVDTLGWMGTSRGITVRIVVNRVLKNRRPGEIVLMHGGSDSGDNSALDAAALPAVIRKLRAYGYSFVTIDALKGSGNRIRASDGGVRNFGTPWYGSDANRLRPGVTAVGLAVDPVTGGYWILTSTGTVNGYHAPARSSLKGKIPPGTTVAAIAASGGGYLILVSDGSVCSFRPSEPAEAGGAARTGR